MQPKDYLSYENKRNREGADLFEALIKKALGADWVTLTGHHFLYQHGSDISTEGEIPSADTLIFDHDVMHAVFNDDCHSIMAYLASVPCDRRDNALRNIFRAYHPDMGV